MKIDAFCHIMPRPYYERGPGYIRATIANLEEIGLSEAEKEAIFRGNVTRLTGLTVTG